MTNYPALMKMVSQTAEEQRVILVNAVNRLEEPELIALEEALGQQSDESGDRPISAELDPIEVYRAFLATRSQLQKLEFSLSVNEAFIAKLPSPEQIGDSLLLKDCYWGTVNDLIERSLRMQRKIQSLEHQLKPLRAFLLADIQSSEE